MTREQVEALEKFLPIERALIMANKRIKAFNPTGKYKSVLTSGAMLTKEELLKEMEQLEAEKEKLMKILKTIK